MSRCSPRPCSTSAPARHPRANDVESRPAKRGHFKRRAVAFRSKSNATGTRRHRRAGRVVKLDRPLIETHDGLTRAMLASVQSQHVLHPAHELLVDLGQAPHLFPPGLQLSPGQHQSKRFAADFVHDAATAHLLGEQAGAPSLLSFGGGPHTSATTAASWVLSSFRSGFGRASSLSACCSVARHGSPLR
jgi:hypothetical protein